MGVLLEYKTPFCTSQLRLPDKKCTDKRKERDAHLNSKRDIRGPAIGTTHNGLYIHGQSLDEIERLSDTVNDTIDIHTAPEHKLESVTEKLLFDGCCE